MLWRIIRILLSRAIRAQILIFGEHARPCERSQLEGNAPSFPCGQVAYGSAARTGLKQHIVLIQMANLGEGAVEFSCQGSDHLRTESCRGFLSGHQRLT
jgi:hypothetical protein